SDLSHGPRVTGRKGEHAAGALNHRLHDDRRQLVSVSGDGALHLVQTGEPAFWIALAQVAAVAVGRWGLLGGKEQWRVGAMEEVDGPNAHGADRVAVVAVVEGEELRPGRLRVRALTPVLKGHLERDLDRGSAGVR